MLFVSRYNKQTKNKELRAKNKEQRTKNKEHSYILEKAQPSNRE